MAGLELLFSSIVGRITSPEDVLVSFVHWEIVRNGYKCLGTGDQPQSTDKKSELLPQGWNSNKELYTLRYQSANGQSQLLVKAITVDSTLIFNILNTPSEKVSDLTVNVNDYIDADNLKDFDRVFKNPEQLTEKVQAGLLPWVSSKKAEKTQRENPLKRETEDDPLRIPSRKPQSHPQPGWRDPMAPFAAGGADLDPFSGRPGGMIVDPLRSGFPRSGFDPSAGIPGRLPPGAVPPGARFDPFGAVGMGMNRPGPDPDHMPPPGYDDMFM
ncbi:proteasome inhibitor PI31 subunit [Paramormyrops kingsleyae]|uniref:Proteasome inhibitor PI31 subunit n=1 Tax=Paramormyrops kingsleyae TaxID=1676925 RepID=A0A3B3RSQ7_9TELE|nr:proteasome inhibitor PI31 subunit [Paramormyrops kingsleyae]